MALQSHIPLLNANDSGKFQEVHIVHPVGPKNSADLSWAFVVKLR